MRMMRKSLILAAVSALTLSACGSDGSSDSATSAASASATASNPSQTPTQAPDVLESADGMPTVGKADDGNPVLEFPDGDAPTGLQISVLDEGKGEEITVDEKAQQEEEALRRPKLLIFNLVLTVALLAVLSTGVVTSYVAFLVALSIGLAVNYPDLKLQDKLIKKHAPAALIISATLFSAGAMVGVFDGTGMLTEMANVIISFVPSFMGQYLHIIFGILALPLGLCIGTDAYFYGIMPLVIEVGSTYGIDPLSTACAMIIGKNLALMVSPLVPATYLATGLTDVELKDHMKFSIPIYWGVSVVMLIVAVFLGVVPLH